MVQLAMIILLATFVFIIGYNYDKITLSPGGYALTFMTAFIGGALYLGLGQMIVGLVKSAETVNSTTRLVYIAFIMLGMFGELSSSWKEFKTVIHWSPFGTVKTILAASMEPSTWNSQSSLALVATVIYAFAFSFLGIRWFKWNTGGS
jgi:ABC-2 type transport system permease protein